MLGDQIKTDSQTSILSLNSVGNWPLLFLTVPQANELCFSNSNSNFIDVYKLSKYKGWRLSKYD